MDWMSQLNLFITFCSLLSTHLCQVAGGTRLAMGAGTATRRDCGYPGITQAACMANPKCLWDSTDIPVPPPGIGNEPWCYYAPQDFEHNLGSSERLDRRFQRKNQAPLRLTNTTIQYSGDCLFHCTSVPIGNRVSCADRDVTMGSCLRGGCCWDKNEQRAGFKCFHAQPSEQECPTTQCQLASGPSTPCFRKPGVDAATCARFGCCYGLIARTPVCYRKQAPAQFLEPERSEGSFIERLRANGADVGRIPIQEMLGNSVEELASSYTTSTTTTTPAPTTTTEVPTTPRTTTAEWTQAPPTTRRVCQWFRCYYQVVPRPPPPQCFPTDCGRPRHYPGSSITPPQQSLKKIVGGSRAYPFSHPWTAMMIKKEGERNFLCGASVICKHWLVTAAHCMNRQSKETEVPDLDTVFYEIYVGRYMGWQYEHGKQVQIFKGRQDIDSIEIHEDFLSGVSRGVITNDIAVIRLRRPIQFNNYVQPICMPTSPALENDILWATGWGITKDKGESNQNMKQLGVKILNETVCDQEVTGFREQRPVGVLCGGGEKNQDTCTGDSGGPLVGPKLMYNPQRRIRYYQWQLYGLTSIGSPSCNTNVFDQQPAIYTNVAHFSEWIKRRTRNCCA